MAQQHLFHYIIFTFLFTINAARYRKSISFTTIECLSEHGNIDGRAWPLQKEVGQTNKQTQNLWVQGKENMRKIKSILITVGTNWTGELLWLAFKILIYCPPSYQDLSKNPSSFCFLNLSPLKGLTLLGIMPLWKKVSFKLLAQSRRQDHEVKSEFLGEDG